MLPPVRVDLRILDHEVSLVGPKEFEEPWRRLWFPFVIEDPRESAPVVSVVATDFGYTLSSPGRDLNVTEIWRALIDTRNDVIRLALEQAQGIVSLHGAVLVRDDQALLLLGKEWAGKTTLALDLVSRGWRYFSDDVVVIDSASGLVRPLPKPPGVKSQPWAEMCRYWDPLPEGLAEPSGSFVVPPPFHGSLEDVASPSWLVFLEFEEAATISTSLPTRGEAVLRAAGHLNEVSPKALEVVEGLTRSCRSILFAYGGGDAAQEIEGLVL